MYSTFLQKLAVLLDLARVNKSLTSIHAVAELLILLDQILRGRIASGHKITQNQMF